MCRARCRVRTIPCTFRSSITITDLVFASSVVTLCRKSRRWFRIRRCRCASRIADLRRFREPLRPRRAPQTPQGTLRRRGRLTRRLVRVRKHSREREAQGDAVDRTRHRSRLWPLALDRQGDVPAVHCTTRARGEDPALERGRGLLLRPRRAEEELRAEVLRMAM